MLLLLPQKMSIEIWLFIKLDKEMFWIPSVLIIPRELQIWS